MWKDRDTFCAFCAGAKAKGRNWYTKKRDPHTRWESAKNMKSVYRPLPVAEVTAVAMVATGYYCDVRVGASRNAVSPSP